MSSFPRSKIAWETKCLDQEASDERESERERERERLFCGNTLRLGLAPPCSEGLIE